MRDVDPKDLLEAAGWFVGACVIVALLLYIDAAAQEPPVLCVHQAAPTVQVWTMRPTGCEAWEVQP